MTEFGLIETLLWTRDDGFHLLPEHLARLASSSAALGFSYDEERVKAALEALVEPPPPQPSPALLRSRERGQVAPVIDQLRVRLVLSKDGTIETGATPVDPVAPDTIWRVAIAKTRFDSNDPLLRHKTTRRALYEDELAGAQARCGADEVLFFNERAEACESARCNLFLARGDMALTPPLSCGLLPGTLRAHLLAEGRAREEILRESDLKEGFLLGNSVRGLVRAQFVR